MGGLWGGGAEVECVCVCVAPPANLAPADASRRGASIVAASPARRRHVHTAHQLREAQHTTFVGEPGARPAVARVS